MVCVVWQRLRNRDKPTWFQHVVLLGLVLADLLVVVGCAIVLEVLMDESYQVLAMVVTHVLVGRLDKRVSSATRSAPDRE